MDNMQRQRFKRIRLPNRYIIVTYIRQLNLGFAQIAQTEVGYSCS
jgi:hypothetical protein